MALNWGNWQNFKHYAIFCRQPVQLLEQRCDVAKSALLEYQTRLLQLSVICEDGIREFYYLNAWNRLVKRPNCCATILPSSSKSLAIYTIYQNHSLGPYICLNIFTSSFQWLVFYLLFSLILNTTEMHHFVSIEIFRANSTAQLLRKNKHC